MAEPIPQPELEGLTELEDGSVLVEGLPEAEGAARGFAHGGSVELNNAARGSIQAKPVLTVQDLQGIITQLR